MQKILAYCSYFLARGFIGYKMFHFIFNYNYRNSWQSFDTLVPLETGMNTLPSRHKLCHFNLTTSPLYLVKLKITQKIAERLLQCVLLTRMFQTFPESCSMFVSFPICKKNSFSSLLTKNLLHSHGFYQKFIFKRDTVNLHVKLNCRELWRVSYDVIKLLSK